MITTTGELRQKISCMSRENLEAFALSVTTHLYAGGVTFPLKDDTTLDPATEFSPDTISDVAWDIQVYIGCIGDGKS